MTLYKSINIYLSETSAVKLKIISVKEKFVFKLFLI